MRRLDHIRITPFVMRQPVTDRLAFSRESRQYALSLGCNMNELKTDGALLERLREASQQKPSAAEIHHQRVSFIMASMSDKKGVIPTAR